MKNQGKTIIIVLVVILIGLSLVLGWKLLFDRKENITQESVTTQSKSTEGTEQEDVIVRDDTPEETGRKIVKNNSKAHHEEEHGHTSKQQTDIETKIKHIRAIYNDTQNKADSYSYKGKKGGYCLYHTHENEVKKVCIPAHDKRIAGTKYEDCYVEYFYEDNEPIFIYTCSQDGKKRENRFYYENGSLIRHIDEDGKIHDFEEGRYDQTGMCDLAREQAADFCE